MSDQGSGVAITFDSGFLGAIKSLSWDGITREVIDVTTFATTGGKAFELSELYDAGEIEAEILFDPDDVPKVMVSGAQASESATVTWSDSGGTTWAVGVLASAFSVSAGDAVDRVLASCTLKCTGAITVT